MCPASRPGRPRTRPRAHRSPRARRPAGARRYPQTRGSALIQSPEAESLRRGASATSVGLSWSRPSQSGDAPAVVAEPEKGRHVGENERLEEIEPRGGADAATPGQQYEDEAGPRDARGHTDRALPHLQRRDAGQAGEKQWIP